ncbi:hypothetical protein LEGA110927_08555 [Leuconostoc gasicomitatum]|uniref:hypothetical protein n=1 Tax=Leuconostoc gelidum group TaxID=3016637 RepID=UPI000BDA6903|nr:MULTISPECIES: hypothetical protein [Leuconostoc gelidum group]MBZ5944920.1 hypothetical protein [Leuconostoc gasicomitatum]MBZ5945819.1 hypothetical protein [Leuconostoc gasicomitatum]MBZ5951145.1 hypothetical protein [Leuconostoc gasicomitatum]MBZ5968516.1 hypothetical protein [Leuconostoc gasicomitatum]MBZ5971852.1 hypothetical protein [Leuconostoc gasicomitatum]
MFDIIMNNYQIIGVTGASLGTAYGVYNVIMAGATIGTIMSLLGPGGTLLGLSTKAVYSIARAMGRKAFVSW